MRYIDNCESLSALILNDHTNGSNPNADESKYEAGLYHMYRPKDKITDSDSLPNQSEREQV